MQTGIVYHENYLRHEQSPSHPERRERIAYTMDLLEEEGILHDPSIRMIMPRRATDEEVLAVHNERYFIFLKQSDPKGAIIDINTYAPPGFLETALLAAGGAVCAGESVISGKVRNAFAMVRPPGHHAGRNCGAGFCYLNNIAIMIRAIQGLGFRRVMILDWDAHHGDGTQDIFYDDPDVLFTSIHQSSLFPGTGMIFENGSGKGQGYTINMPIPSGSSDDVYMMLMDEIIAPAAEEFRPDFIAVSAGQDCHFTDPITSLAVTSHGYAKLMSSAVDLAGRLCAGRLAVVLEGGYGVEGALPLTNLGIIAALAGMDLSQIREPELYLPLLESARDPLAFAKAAKTVEELKKILADYWSFASRS